MRAYRARLAAATHLRLADAAAGRLRVSSCACGQELGLRVRPSLADTWWETLDGSPMLVGREAPAYMTDPALDPGAYSRAKAWRGFTGRWPWEHAHVPSSTAR